MNTSKFCFKFSDNSDTMFFGLSSTYVHYYSMNTKERPFFNTPYFLQWQNFFFSITSFFYTKKFGLYNNPRLLNSLTELKFQKQQIFT